MGAAAGRGVCGGGPLGAGLEADGDGLGVEDAEMVLTLVGAPMSSRSRSRTCPTATTTAEMVRTPAAARARSFLGRFGGPSGACDPVGAVRAVRVVSEDGPATSGAATTGGPAAAWSLIGGVGRARSGVRCTASAGGTAAG